MRRALRSRLAGRTAGYQVYLLHLRRPDIRPRLSCPDL